MTIDVRALPCTDGSVIDLADPQVTQYTQWQVPSNDKQHTHPLVLSNDPFFNLRGITRELFDNAKIGDEKFLAVDFLYYFLDARHLHNFLYPAHQISVNILHHHFLHLNLLD